MVGLSRVLLAIHLFLKRPGSVRRVWSDEGLSPEGSVILVVASLQCIIIGNNRQKLKYYS